MSETPREIKFRAWDKDGTLEMIYLNLGDFLDPPQEFEGGLDGFVVMQYMGRKDKNGKEIYEGDIVRGKAETVVIEWKDEMWTEEGFITGFSELFEGANCYEVIGNIYENPDMLKNG